MTAAESAEQVPFASPIDASMFGEYRPRRAAGTADRHFRGRISASGASGYRAQPGRYHLYAGWSCPRSHRAALVVALAGLDQVVSVSYVDELRDARGWAFRERTGPDPVNGFTLLSEAYEASDPGYDAAVTIPVLWDRHRHRIVSNDPDTIDVDLATAFAAWSTPDVVLYPDTCRTRVDELSSQLAGMERHMYRAVFDGGARASLAATLAAFNNALDNNRFLTGNTITIADIRLWTLLVRYDAGPNATGVAGPPLTAYAGLWRYAQELYGYRAFQATTNFAAFTAPFTRLPGWGRGSG